MKTTLLLTTAIAGFFAFRAATAGRSAPVSPAKADVAEITRDFLLKFVLPAWLAAGIADWACHRASSIETTSGPKESLIHLLMLTEAAVPVLAGMFLEMHSYLEMIPVMAVSFIAVLHWPQLCALLGIGRKQPDWGIRWTRRALGWRYTAAMLAAQMSLEWFPYLEELTRTLRVGKARRALTTRKPA